LQIAAHPEAAEDRRKQFAALARAVPISRMIDYGAPVGDAMLVHEATAAAIPPAWDELCERLAQRHLDRAQEAAAAGSRLTASDAFRAASALLQCGQLAFNADSRRKTALYAAAQSAMVEHAALSVDLNPLRIDTPAGDLNAWLVRPPSGTAAAAVVVIGGLSGWGASYLDMGRALAARGVLAILGEGPGQGLTRMEGGMHLDAGTLSLFSRFVDHAASLGASRIGVWGNSFGGLFAAHLAVSDARVCAACINGAPMVPTVPDFRTAREQMEAVFGTHSDHELAARVRDLALDPDRHLTRADLLLVEGGRDPLVPLGSQSAFTALTTSSEVSTLTWQDGEHTIYNRAAERDASVADWFAMRLRSKPI
jgi:dienelactone hydrolase